MDVEGTSQMTEALLVCCPGGKKKRSKDGYSLLRGKGDGGGTAAEGEFSLKKASKTRSV